MFKEVRKHLLSKLFQSYCASHDLKSMFGHDFNTVNYLTILDLPSNSSGRVYMARLLAAIGFIQEDEKSLPELHSDQICMADEDNDNIFAPKLILADFRVEEMPSYVRSAIKKFTHPTVPFDYNRFENLCSELRTGDKQAAHSIASLIYEYIVSRQWPLPTLNEYRKLSTFSEMLARVVALGRSVGYITLPMQSNIGYYDFEKSLSTMTQNGLNLDNINYTASGRFSRPEKVVTLGNTAKINIADGTLTLPQSLLELTWDKAI